SNGVYLGPGATDRRLWMQPRRNGTASECSADLAQCGTRIVCVQSSSNDWRSSTRVLRLGRDRFGGAGRYPPLCLGQRAHYNSNGYKGAHYMIEAMMVSNIVGWAFQAGVIVAMLALARQVG